jgi:hypothetical protein
MGLSLPDKYDSKNLDRAVAAYRAEADRWDWRFSGDGYELIRNSSPRNDIIAEQYMEIIPLRRCPSNARAQKWLETFRGRAAMRAALEKL